MPFSLSSVCCLSGIRIRVFKCCLALFVCFLLSLWQFLFIIRPISMLIEVNYLWIFISFWVCSKVKQISRLASNERGEIANGNFTGYMSLVTPPSLTGVTSIRLWAIFLGSQRDPTPSVWLLCSGSLTEYAEKDHFLRYLCLWTASSTPWWIPQTANTWRASLFRYWHWWMWPELN